MLHRATAALLALSSLTVAMAPAVVTTGASLTALTAMTTVFVSLSAVLPESVESMVSVSLPLKSVLPS